MLDYFKNLFDLFVDMSVYIMLGLFVVGILNTFVNKKWITGQIGKDNFWSVIKASMIGVPLPLCSCGVVPTAIELKKSGGSNGSVVSFLISTPQTGIDSIVATFGMLGGFMAFFRAIAAFISGIIGGAMVNILGKNEKIDLQAEQSCHCHCESDTTCCESSTVSSCCCGSDSTKIESACKCSSENEEKHEVGTTCCESSNVSSYCCGSDSVKVESACKCGNENEEKHEVGTTCCCHGSDKNVEGNNKVISKIKHVFTYAYGSFLDEIAVHFVIGLLVSALISTVIPADFFVNLGLDKGIISMLLMVLVGLPMYICSTSSIPIAVSLVMKGLSPGAAFVFLFTGPVTNAASLAMLTKTLGKKITAIYISSVVVCSVAFGLLFDFMSEKLNLGFVMGESTHLHGEDTPLVFYVIASVFFVLILKGLYMNIKAKVQSKKI